MAAFRGHPLGQADRSKASWVSLVALFCVETGFCIQEDDAFIGLGVKFYLGHITWLLMR